MKTNIFYTLLCLFTIFASCKKNKCQSNDPDFEVQTIVPTGEEVYLNRESDYIFNQEKLPTFELQIPGPALEKLNCNPAAEEYVEGRLVFEGDTLSPVGIRYKGSVGAFVGCVSGKDWIKPSGHKVCTKLSMKVKINWNGSKNKFYGLKKLQFHSQNLDKSQMRERLAYTLFRAMKVPAPRSVHARLVVNGKYVGLFALTEQVDDRFAKHNFDDGDGNLYKEVWPLNAENQAQSDEKYMEGLQTNEDDNPSFDIIRNFAQALATAENENMQSIVTEFTDINKLLSYFVVDRTIHHDDGPLHWYCFDDHCSNHNYYWYEETSKNKLHLVAWDLDNAFENIVANENPVTALADKWGETSHNCEAFPFGAWQLKQRSAACDKLIHTCASFTAEYEQLKNNFMTNVFAESQLTPLLDAWEEQIRAAIIEASGLYGDAVSVEEWEEALSELRASLVVARE